MFKLFITKDRVEKVKKVEGELLEKRGRKVAIKEIACFCGLMTSLGLDGGSDR